ncbi:MAG: hypothetical protein JXB30_01635 [Anaerolineae bacterium]|nr:hypothetical protein [Anaerolineae bacterium]
MLRRYCALLLALIVILTLPSSALAQSYYFSLDKEVVHAYWNQDGTLALDYTFVFTNEPGAHVIDFVDVGLPNGNFNINGISADVGGRSVQISSDYQGTGSGVAVDLGADAIQPGQSGTVHVSVQQVRNVLHPDSSDDQYASAVFSPTWFDSQFVTGSTSLTVVFHLPPGVQPEEPRWHEAPSGFPSEPQTGLDNNGRVMYTWSASNASGSTQYIFGASFPKSYVPEGAIVTSSPFDFSGLLDTLCGMGPMLCVCPFILIVIGVSILGAVQGQRRKLQYLPPRISIEGHGIKRGLTAIEAAIVMEEPLDKVMTMVLFAVIKKNAARVLSHDPLKLDVASPLPEDLRDYEMAFLDAFQENDTLKRRKLLQEVSVNLVKSTSEKMKGFSRKETVAYYKSIMEKAWQQVEAAETPEVKSQLFEEAMDWTMLDRDFDDRARRVFTGPVYVPMWWGRYDPTFSRPSAPAESLPGRLPSVPVPHLPGSDFASSLAGGIQSFSQRVIGDVTTFTSRVTGVTNPPPPPSSSHSGRSGSGCACACACAGCACACAGGGR